jgi:TonB-dependent starch-binding outer membrane protein SusC
MKKLLQGFLWVLMFISLQAYAQTRTVTGKVTGKEDRQPLPGVSVVVKGTNTGTQTGSDGSYSISVAPGQSLTFSFLGFTSQTITPSGARLDVELSSGSSTLNDVVVIGYGTQVRKDAPGSVSTVRGRDIADQPVQNIQQALGGRIAGAQVSIPNGVVNSTPVIRIRGTNSINGSSQPLYVIDGVPSYSSDFGGTAAGSALGAINPEDVEDIQVAKDAAATAIYGSRAANGVIYITTKRGKKGKAVVSLESWVGMNKPFGLPKMLNAEQYTDLKNEGLRNAGTFVNTGPVNSQRYYALTLNPDGSPVSTDWQDLIYRTGTSYSNTLSISGGSDATNYYVSANHTRQEGLLRGNSFNRKNILANIDHRANKFISVGAKISYANTDNLAITSSGSQDGEAFGITGLGRIGLVLPPNISPYNADGSYNLNGNTLGLGANRGITVSYYNIVPLLDLNRANNELNQVASNVHLNLNPFPWLTFRTQYGIDYIYRNTDTFQSPVQGDGNPNGLASGTFNKSQRWVWSNTLQAVKTIGEKHNIDVLIGNEQQRSINRGFGITRTVISDPAFNVIQAGFSTNAPAGNAFGENYLVSFFGRVNYNFDNKYYLSGTVRSDEYSGFGANNKRGYFPGGEIAYDIAKEGFWSNMKADKIFSAMKLRVSYGRVGNTNGVGNYDSYGLYASGLYNGGATLLFNSTGNPNLAWETITKLDIGANFGLFNDRITGSITYYKNDISDLILGVPTAPSAGLPSSPSLNIASMFNRGLEFEISAQAVRSADFSYTPSFNITFNRNQLTSLAQGVPRLTVATSGSETANISEIGHSLGSLYIVRTEGVDPATGRRIFLNGAGRQVFYNRVPAAGRFQWEYADGTQAPQITQNADAVNYAQTQPKAFGGFNNDFRYKSFDVSLLFTYQLGGYVYYGTQAGLRDQRFWNNSVQVLDRWTTPGQVTEIPRLVADDNISNGSSLPISANVYKGDFLKLKSFTVGYTLPKTLVSKIGLSNLRFYVNGFNALIFSGYPGPDPEVSSNGISNLAQGIDRNTAGNSRTFTAGLSAKF